MTHRWPLWALGAMLALSGCSKSDLPSLEDFDKFPQARGNLMSGWIGTTGAATPGMVAEKFGQPVKTEDQTGKALPNRLLYYRAKDAKGQPMLVRLRFISVCGDKTDSPDCFRLTEVSRATAE